LFVVSTLPPDVHSDEVLEALSPRSQQANDDKMEKRLEESFTMTCPMYVCAFVATLVGRVACRFA
jgi:hypothetical protein